MTLLEALRQMYPDSSKRTLQNWVKNGRFSIDGKQIFIGNQLLESGQRIVSKETFKPLKDPRLKILYEDRYLIVIDKPTGLLSVPLDEGKTKRDALTLLREVYSSNQIFAVHRIDRETSGVLLFARGKESQERFDKLFEKHAIKREYFAIVEGRIKESKGSWHSKLLELPNYTVVESVDGKDAITHFEVIRRSTKYTYVKFRLETGKKHQIRVQCQMHSHPVVGDFRYGSTESPIKRLCLHACTLGFRHPFTKRDIEFTSPLPKSFMVLGASCAILTF